MSWLEKRLQKIRILHPLKHLLLKYENKTRKSSILQIRANDQI